MTAAEFRNGIRKSFSPPKSLSAKSAAGVARSNQFCSFSSTSTLIGIALQLALMSAGRGGRCGVIWTLGLWPLRSLAVGARYPTNGSTTLDQLKTHRDELFQAKLDYRGTTTPFLKTKTPSKKESRNSLSVNTASKSKIRSLSPPVARTVSMPSPPSI